MTIVNPMASTGISMLIRQHPGRSLSSLLEEARAGGYRYLLVTGGSFGDTDIRALETLLTDAGENDCSVAFARTITDESAFLRGFSRVMVRAEADLKLTDPHTPYICWPVNAADRIKPVSRGYADMERLIHLALRGIPVRELPLAGSPEPVPVKGIPRQYRGFFHLNGLHLILSLASLFWFRPIGWFRRFRKKNIRQAMAHLFGMEDPPLKKALSLAFGLFMGILPIYGFQMMITLPVAIFLRMNKSLVILGVQISSPPFIPLLVFLGIRIGGFVLREPFPALTLAEASLKSIALAARQFAAGSVILALGVSVTAGLFSFLIFTFASRRKKRA